MNVAERSIRIPADSVMLDADLAVPEPAAAVVLFAHGSGSSRHSPRNRFVARELQRSGLATVLADLLTPPEEQLDARTGRLRFDIGLLARRVTAITDWLAEHQPTAGVPVGLFGASTGAAAMEGLLAFFAESTFIGLWLFGRNRLPALLHTLSICVVSLATVVSAFFILAANAWMQHPVGYRIVGNKAELADSGRCCGTRRCGPSSRTPCWPP